MLVLALGGVRMARRSGGASVNGVRNGEILTTHGVLDGTSRLS